MIVRSAGKRATRAVPVTRSLVLPVQVSATGSAAVPVWVTPPSQVASELRRVAPALVQSLLLSPGPAVRRARRAGPRAAGCQWPGTSTGTGGPRRRRQRAAGGLTTGCHCLPVASEFKFEPESLPARAGRRPAPAVPAAVQVQ